MLEDDLCLAPAAVDDDEGASIRAPNALVDSILEIHHGRGEYSLAVRILWVECREKDKRLAWGREE
jgi:hypothetical protein